MPEGETRTPVRIRDIAEALGISPATVSNALGEKRGVSRETIRRVRAMAESLGYDFDQRSSQGAIRAIRLLILQKHGMVVMDTQFFAELIQGIEAACRSRRLDLIVTRMQVADVLHNPRELQALLSEDGQALLLLATELSAGDLGPLLACGKPFLALDHSFPDLDVSCVLMDNHRAGRLAAQALLAAGHRRCGVLTSLATLHNMEERVEGFRKGLGLAGLLPELVAAVPPTLEGAYAGALRLLEGLPPSALPTAFFACNDIIAAGAMRAFERLGLRVPADVSVIGMDNLDLCALTNPPLSSLHVPRAAIGACAVNRLLALCREGAAFGVQKTALSVAPVLRESIGAPADR